MDHAVVRGQSACSSVWSVSSSPGGEQMRTNPDEFGDTSKRLARVEHDAAIDGVLHSLVDVGEQHGCALDGDEIDEL